MKYAIFGDIHGNLEAFDAVVADISLQKADKLVCLGDIVGYGADPQACVDKIRELDCLTVLGNHDMVSVGLMDADSFNQFARIAALWTKESLDKTAKEFLKGLPLTGVMDDFHFTHANLYAPSLYEYIQTSYDAVRNFEKQEKPLCFVGHSHIPVTLIFKKGILNFTLDKEVSMDPEAQMIINVGSVGQPRDENPQASYAIYDSDKHMVHIRRVSYNIQKASKKIRDAKLPEINAERLFHGR